MIRRCCSDARVIEATGADGKGAIFVMLHAGGRTEVDLMADGGGS